MMNLSMGHKTDIALALAVMLVVQASMLTLVSLAEEPAADASINPMQDKRNTRCPAWISDYASFHAENKHASGSKYLVYWCEDGCKGLGDMIRGIMWLLRLAISTQRIFLIHSTHPIDLSLLLPPAQLDWRVGNITLPQCVCEQDAHHHQVWQMFPERMSNLIFPPPRLDMWSPSCSCTRPSLMLEKQRSSLEKSGLNVEEEGLKSHQSYMFHRQFTDGGPVTFPEWFTNGSLFCGSVSNVTFLVCSTNMMAHWFIPQPLNFPHTLDILEHGSDTHCLFNALFQAAPEVAARANLFREDLNLLGSIPYVAVHLRLGGFKGEEAAVIRHSDNDTAMVFDCARRLAARHNMSALILLAVDNAEMRREAVMGHFPGGAGFNVEGSAFCLTPRKLIL